MFKDILVYWKSFNRLIRQTLKIWTKPAAALLIASAVMATYPIRQMSGFTQSLFGLGK